MKLKSLITMCICFYVTGCLTDNEVKKAKEINNSTYYQYDAGFSLSLPSAWDSKLDQSVGDLKIDMASKAAPIENFSANVTVIISNNSGTSDIPTIINMIKSQAQQSSPGIEFLSDTVLVIENVNVGKIIYKGNMFGMDLKFTQLIFVRNNLDVQIEFTDLEKYYDGRSEFTSIENSLKFL